MPRITRRQLDQLVTVLNNRVTPPKGKRYALEYAYGRPRLILEDKKKLTARDISPRLPTGALYMWISAFIDGAEACERGW